MTYINNKMKKIYVGIDQLEFTLNGPIRAGVIETLEKAKQQAIKKDCEVIFEFNGLKGLIKPNGGAGGWKYILDTGTETFTVKDTQWGVRISVRSLFLSNLGYKGALDDVLKRADILIARSDVRVGRIDIAIDVQAPRYLLIKTTP